jgi:alpha 1,3-glucosidase
VFWNNPSEAFVDVAKETSEARARWMSESGVFDLTVLPGPDAKAVFSQYSTMTGTQALPPRFALGYHQCRWNYKDEADVFGVDAKFEEHSFPYDVLWLDIEHTDGKRYFTWDKALFPDSAAMQNKLAERGRKMVTIVDPHIKRDSNWRIHSEATSKGLYIKNKEGADFDGWCWPGSSSYLDFTDPNVRNWWASQFAVDKYEGSTTHLYTWNDMNEPSVFNGPEVSMSKEAKSLAGVEHREWHNLYGFYQQMATAQGQELRAPDGNTRPFVLSRAFFAGSQRYGAIWTGDNDASWEHLKIASPMLMTIALSGLSFAGADVGGFFNNPDVELMQRWYQAGSFQPFFRAHAHIDTKRREPWLFGDEVLTNLRSTVRARYALLPFWYSKFYATHTTGMPIITPLWVEYPDDEETFAMEDQWIAGGDLLVKPVTDAGAESVSMYFPGKEVWVDVASLDHIRPGRHTISAPLTKIPVFQRAGSIIPRQVRPRRCTKLMESDPYTVTVVVDSTGAASGDLYLDDGISYDFARSSAYRLRSLTFSGGKTGTLRSTRKAGGKAFTVDNEVKRIIVIGLGAQPLKVFASGQDGVEAEVGFTYDGIKDAAVVRKPVSRWRTTLQSGLPRLAAGHDDCARVPSRSRLSFAIGHTTSRAQRSQPPSAFMVQQGEATPSTHSQPLPQALLSAETDWSRLHSLQPFHRDQGVAESPGRRSVKGAMA